MGDPVIGQFWAFNASFSARGWIVVGLVLWPFVLAVAACGGSAARVSGAAGSDSGGTAGTSGGEAGANDGIAAAGAVFKFDRSG